MEAKQTTSSAPSANADLTPQKNLATIVYALQAAGFFIGFTYFLAPIVNYVKRDAVKGTWVESHFRWQLATFWYSLGWGVFGALTWMWEIGFIVLTAVALWVVYRIDQGWMALTRNQSLPEASVFSFWRKPQP